MNQKASPKQESCKKNYSSSIQTNNQAYRGKYQSSSTMAKKMNFADFKPSPSSSTKGSFSFPTSKPLISSNLISSFLINVGQDPVQNSENYFTVKCPNCNNDSQLSANKTFVKPGSGGYYCTACTSKGDWEKFMDLTLQNKKSESIVPTKKTAIGHDCISQLDETKFSPLSEFPALKKFLIGPKGIFSEETINNFWISAYTCTPLVDPSINPRSQDTTCLSFPRTCIDPNSSSEGTPSFRIVSTRAVSFPDGKLIAFEPSTSIEPGFFGYHLISPTCDTIALAPREFDAMAVYEGTGIPCVCLPRTENQLSIEHMPLLARFKRIYLWFDGDVQGQRVAQILARKLGLDRTFIVKNESSSGITVHNAFEALKKQLNMKEMISAAKLHTHSKVMSFSSLHDSVMLEIMHADQVQGTRSTDFPQFNELTKGLRPGELTVFTGPTGTGKTTFLSQLSLDYAKSGVSTLWGSFEISNTRLAKRMLFQLAGKSLEGDLEEFNYWAESFKQLPMYFMRFFGTTRVEEVIEAMEHAVHAYDVQHVLIDNLQFMSSGLGRGFERFEIQDEALSLFRRFATQQNVHVTLVVHPRKDERALLDVGSIFGSAKMTQEADNVIILQSGPKQYRYIDVKKNRFDGATGMVPVRFDRETSKSIELTEEERKELKKLIQ
ncbi:hypothetical protein DSO57_1011852 [Entomophthora muscae]|uniref:Uncharacterized protein n=1 Tax=Entomophthora muscae TaxID=34485 RepID=A0ACC2S833_9FUNG|nr:hypothetical protein DSO57_1011852 [Entomophthora muscae]